MRQQPHPAPQVPIPTEAGLPRAFGNAFRNVASLVSDIDFTFKEATLVLVLGVVR